MMSLGLVIFINSPSNYIYPLISLLSLFYLNLNKKGPYPTDKYYLKLIKLITLSYSLPIT